MIDNAGQSVGRDEWDAYRRAEVQRLFDYSIHGKSPSRRLAVRHKVVETDPKALDDRATSRQIAAFFGDDEYRFDILLNTPNNSTSPVAGFVSLNFSVNHTVHADPASSSEARKRLAARP
ncbi:hypothetical protein [Aureliella helgolandensis]|uniref:hypothetical protein n=1 Tax=Aureliella helgolandensis TaxID=2527968 RepID=UPI0018D01B7D|nr:hypothetical protein [Aureliella helgolandensis]